MKNKNTFTKTNNALNNYEEIKNTNTNNTSSSKILSSLFVVLFIFATLFATASSAAAQATDDETAMYNTVDAYYEYFGEQNMDAYLGTQFLSHLSKEELSEKKKLIEEMWSQFNSGYSLSDKEDWDFSINDDLAIVSFKLSADIMDKNYNPIKSYEQPMTAVLFKTKTGDWKIFNMVPTAVFNFNLVADVLPKEDEEQPPANEETNTTINYTPSNGPSCDAQGNCAKYGPSLHRPQETKPRCDFDLNMFKKSEGYSLEDVPGVKTLIGNDKIIKFVIDDSSIFYYHFLDGKVQPITASPKIDFLVTTDSCTLQRIDEGADPQEEYRSGNIHVKGQSFGSKISAGIGKLIFTIYSWFSPKQPFELWVEAETGELHNAGKYSFEGPTSRGPGELYLGTKDSFANYTLSSDYEGPVHLYLSISDDGLHSNGTRDAVFILNGDEKLRYNHVSRNTETEGSYWTWVDLGTVHLKKGKNTLVIQKPEQTSAAFILDKFVFSENEKSFD